MIEWFDILRKKWSEIPGDNSNRFKSPHLLEMSDQNLLYFWTKTLENDTRGDRFSVRGWYHLLYSDILRGKKVLDLGSGLGMDALTFAKAGAEVTCADIVKTNLLVIQRLAKIQGIHNINFLYINHLDSFKKLDNNYDVIWCQGSLINAPFELIRAEVQELINHLKPNGRFIELAYPKERWIREGSMPFEQWGERTDGKGTPYMEWYDLEKIRSLFAPTRIDVVLYFNFHNNDFNWFDLVVRK